MICSIIYSLLQLNEAEMFFRRSANTQIIAKT